MAKTIIQTIGPLYGEAVNGTVFGRPNGSVFVPLSNTIEISLTENYRYIKPVSATLLRVCNSTGTYGGGQANTINYVAQVQDLASNIQMQIYADAECTQLVAFTNVTAGIFNRYMRDFNNVISSITNGTTYYLRAQVMNNNIPVATSNIIEIVGVVDE